MSESKSHNIANYFSVKQEMLALYGSFSKKGKGAIFRILEKRDIACNSHWGPPLHRLYGQLLH